MARQIQLRRGTAEQHEQFIGADGEVTVDTTNRTLRVHDGETPGGIALARADAAGTGMPSDAYIDLVFGASGTKYTAPTDGYFALARASGTSGAYLTLLNLTSGIGITNDGYQIGTKYLWIPAAAGDTVTSTYSFSGAISYFRFVKVKSAQ